jgi:hypothetical protein
MGKAVPLHALFLPITGKPAFPIRENSQRHTFLWVFSGKKNRKKQEKRQKKKRINKWKNRGRKNQKIFNINNLYQKINEFIIVSHKFLRR